MGFFGKKKEAKPVTIPEAPELAFPEIPEIEAQENPSEEAPGISEKEFSLPELPEIPEAPGIIPDIEELGGEKLQELPGLSVSITKSRKPLFVNIDDYRELISQLSNAKSLLAENAGFAARVNNLKVSRDEAYEKFRGALETIERKLLYMDKIIFEGG